jgi:hypothetical protein
MAVTLVIDAVTSLPNEALLVIGVDGFVVCVVGEDFGEDDDLPFDELPCLLVELELGADGPIAVDEDDGLEADESLCAFDFEECPQATTPTATVATPRLTAAWRMRMRTVLRGVTCKPPDGAVAYAASS